MGPAAPGAGTSWGGQCGTCGPTGYGYGQGHASTAALPRIPVHVRAEKPIDVIVDLEPGAECWHLSVTDLRRHGDREGHRIARFDREHGPLRLSIHVGNDVEPGRYVGHVLDDCNVCRGEVTIDVHANRGAAPHHEPAPPP
jgi:hypothetical protein